MITQEGGTAASKLSSKARFFSAVPLSVSINELMVAGIAVRGSYRIGSKSFSLATARNSSASRFVPAIAKLLFVIGRSEEHTSELQSQFHLVCRLLLEKKKNKEET